jgi:hypothetical protein
MAAALRNSPPRTEPACAAPTAGWPVTAQVVLHLRHIARLLQAPFSTVARTLSGLGLGRLRNLEPKPPVQRYEWERPGDLIHVDVKTLARFRKVGLPDHRQPPAGTLLWRRLRHGPRRRR